MQGGDQGFGKRDAELIAAGWPSISAGPRINAFRAYWSERGNERTLLAHGEFLVNSLKCWRL
jgi:hypothetical protein